MTESALISTVFTRELTSPCLSCEELPLNGLNKEANGSFESLLQSSISKSTELPISLFDLEGELLPQDGKTLPNFTKNISVVENDLLNLTEENPVLFIGKEVSNLLNDAANGSLTAEKNTTDLILKQPLTGSSIYNTDTNQATAVINPAQHIRANAELLESPPIVRDNAPLSKSAPADKLSISVDAEKLNISNNFVEDQAVKLEKSQKLILQEPKIIPDLAKPSHLGPANIGFKSEGISALKNFIKGSSIRESIGAANISNTQQQSQIIEAIKINGNSYTGQLNHVIHHTGLSPVQGSSAEAPLPLQINSQAYNSIEAYASSKQDSVFQNIKWMVSNNIQNANIKVHPESLGPINVSLNVEDSKLTVNFLANNVIAKEAIDINLLALKDLLNEGGLNFKEVDINSRFSQQNNQDSDFSQQLQSGRENNNKSNSESLVNSKPDQIIDNSQHTVELTQYLVDAYI